MAQHEDVVIATFTKGTKIDTNEKNTTTYDKMQRTTW